jgi:hypothetical protein
MKNKRTSGPVFESQPAFNSDNEIARWVQSIVEKNEPNNKHQDFQLDCFVLASALVGPDAKRIATMLEIPARLAAFWEANLRLNGIWKHGRVHCDRWFNDEFGLVSFTCDTLAAEGVFERQLNEDGVPTYTPITGGSPGDTDTPWHNQ